MGTTPRGTSPRGTTSGETTPDESEAGSADRVIAAPGRGWLQHLAAPLAILVPAAIALALFHALSRQMDYHAITALLRRLPPGAFALSLAASLFSYAALVARDGTILRFLGVPVDRMTLLIGAFCGSALGNAIGFGTLSGGAVRYRIYGAAGVRPAQIARLMGWILVCFGAGLLVFGAASAALAAGAIGRLVHLRPEWVRIGGILVLAAAALLAVIVTRGGAAASRMGPPQRGASQVGASRIGPVPAGSDRQSGAGGGTAASAWLRARGFTLQRPGLGFLLVQLGVLSADLLGAGAALYVLLPDTHIGFAPFMAVYTVALALGVLSHVPGGLGVFEAVVIFALGRAVAANQVAAALLAYRAIYFFLPLLVSAGLLAAVELRAVSRRITPAGLARLRHGAEALAPVYLGVITFAIGAMLVVSGATPAFSRRLATLQTTVPLWVVETSHLLASLLGVALLFVARGLFRRLDGAWWLALGITAISLVLAIAKGLAFVEAGVLCCLLALLLATRRRFDRPAWLLGERFTPGWNAAVALVVAVSIWMMSFAFRDVPYAGDLWWQFAFDAKAPRALRATFAAAALAGAIGLWQLLRLSPGRVGPPTAPDLARATAILRAQPHADALLALMGDKSFLFSESGRAFLMYAKRGRSWVALHGPVGPVEDWQALIGRFVALADAHGGRAAFYQIRPETLGLYLDAGLQIMKLGEEARIDLASWSLAGPGRSHLRYALKRGARDGLTYERVPRDAVATLIRSLAMISSQWLAGRGAREKGFSVAWFSPAYVAAQSVALVRQNGRPVAFATLMTTDLHEEASIGVMRHLSDASAYAMEFLFTSLALDLQGQGWRWLSLGMAPLSGLAATPLASIWHRLGGLLWQHGGRLYDFQGLRRFKNKFQPEWQPRYLAASGTVGPFLALADVAALAGGAAASRHMEWA